LPNFVIKNFVALENCIVDVTSDDKKKMNKTNAQAYTKLKQKFKKYLTESGDNENFYEAQVLKYREDPPEDSEKESQQESGEDNSNDSSSSDKDSSSDSSDSDKSEKIKVVSKKKVVESDDDSGSSSSSSDSSDGSDSDSKASDHEAGSAGDESEEEQVVVKSGQLPKKYAFLALPREVMTTAQRRWKWVKFEFLPEEMKKFVRPPNEKKEKKDKNEEKDGAKKEKKIEVKEQIVEIEDDKDLDYTKMDNVEKTLTKYKN
jgi:hypothetical protein